MFEIKAKDNMGRVGVLKTKHGNVKTPALMPVIHPRKQAIDVGKYGADIVITNAYLIYKDEELKQRKEETLKKIERKPLDKLHFLVFSLFRCSHCFLRHKLYSRIKCRESI